DQVLSSFYPNLTIFKLGLSFRSSEKILNCAQKLLTSGDSLLLTAYKNLEAKLLFCKAPQEHSEARWIAQKISKLLGSSSHSLNDQTNSSLELERDLSLADIAILVRFKMQIPPLVKALKSAGIPYVAPSVEAFYQDEVMQKFLEYCDPNLPNPANFPFQKNPLPAPEFLASWLNNQPWAGFEASKSQAFKELSKFYAECGSWEQFFKELIWLKEEEALKSRAESVQILTLHASKGLEFTACFIPGLELGILPADSSLIENPAKLNLNQVDEEERLRKLEEEKRLFYVGITRASQIIGLSCAKQRTIYGQNFNLPISPFYTQISNMFQAYEIKSQTKNIQKQGSLLGL
ncbi:MAG: ATP-dependent helicase, partial [Desulfovibrionaceae bacterium]|nr:ATP-dependent helicase [Desulfovibrionaceae bacterium]